MGRHELRLEVLIQGSSYWVGVKELELSSHIIPL